MMKRARSACSQPVAVTVLACVLALALAACGKSRVVRTAGVSHLPAPGQSVAKPGQSLVVRKGDTIYRLAVNRRIHPQDLAAWNGIRPPYTIHPGQRLNLYPSARQGSGRSAQTAGRARAAASSSGTRTTTPTPNAPPIRSSIQWRWPTTGDVSARFAEGDTTRQGIDITGRGGQPIRAAAAGVVVYSGSGLVGYGELVIIKHDEQWLSAYGHNRRRLVNEGAQVKVGEQIAEMGRTGAARDMLHFEIRYNGHPVDPLLYLPAR